MTGLTEPTGIESPEVGMVIALVIVLQILMELMRKFVFKTYGTHDAASHEAIIAAVENLTRGCGEIKSTVSSLERADIHMTKALADLQTEWGRQSTKAHRMVQQINELHGWHDHDDPDEPGVKIWWTRRSLEKAIRENTESMRILSATLRARIPKNGSSD